MAKRLVLAFLYVTVASSSLAQFQVAPLGAPQVISANAVELSGDNVRTENSGNVTEIILAGAARLELRESNSESLVITGDHLQVRSDQLRWPQNAAAKRNLWVAATGNCVFAGKRIRCHANQLQLTENSETASFDIKLDGAVMVSVGNATLTAETAVVSRSDESYQLRGTFTLSSDDEPSDAAKPAVEIDPNGEECAARFHKLKKIGVRLRGRDPFAGSDLCGPLLPVNRPEDVESAAFPSRCKSLSNFQLLRHLPNLNTVTVDGMVEESECSAILACLPENARLACTLRQADGSTRRICVGQGPLRKRMTHERDPVTGELLEDCLSSTGDKRF